MVDLRRNLAAALGVLLVGACAEPDLPERASPYDFRLSATDPVFHWPLEQLPTTFFAEPAGAVPEYVRRGVRAWEAQFLYGEFRGELIDDSTAADVVVRIDGDAPPDAPLTDDPPAAVCEGITHVPPTAADDQGRLQYAEAFRIELRWFPAPNPSDVANCLARVAAHEIGHALGIFAHSPDPDDLMFGTATAPEPSARDQATVQSLYHQPTEIFPATGLGASVNIIAAGMSIP